MNDLQKAALKKVLKVELAKPEYTGKSPDEIHAMLTEPKKVQAAGIEKPKPMSITRLLANLSPDSTAKLVSWVNFTDFRDKVKAQDFDSVAVWGRLMLAGGLISQAELAAMQSELAQTETTPGAVTFDPPLIHTLLSGSNLKALGIESEWMVKEGQKFVLKSLSMPNTVSVDELAEVIASL